jgi:hypothetical protein
MPDISISIDDRAVRAMLTRAPNQVSQAMRGASNDAGTYILAIQRRYPPQRPGSSYRRTNTLNKSWSMRISGTSLGVRVTIGSNGAVAPSNRYVQDRDRQARIHRGRWRNTVQHTAETERDRVVRFYADRLAMVGR